MSVIILISSDSTHGAKTIRYTRIAKKNHNEAFFSFGTSPAPSIVM